MPTPWNCAQRYQTNERANRGEVQDVRAGGGSMQAAERAAATRGADVCAFRCDLPVNPSAAVLAAALEFGPPKAVRHVAAQLPLVLLASELVPAQPHEVLARALL